MTGSFDDLFATHFVIVTRLAGLLGADDPEDVAQEAFTRLHARMPRLRDDSAGLAYVRRTAINLVRSRQRHLLVVRKHAAGRREESVPSTEEAVSSKDEQRRVATAVASLPTRQREVVVLRYWANLSPPEVAATLRMPVGTVKSTTARALIRLATMMGEAGGERF